jgi:hypothetical protein
MSDLVARQIAILLGLKIILGVRKHQSSMLYLKLGLA